MCTHSATLFNCKQHTHNVRPGADHTFFWEGMCANGGGAPTGAVGDAITTSFGSYDEFATQFKAAGATQFGSGWAWLIADGDGKLSIDKTPNAVCPLVEGATCPL